MSQVAIADQAIQTTEAPALDIFEQQALLIAQREKQNHNFADVEDEDIIVADDEKDDAAIAAEKEQKKANVRRAKFQNMIQETRMEHVHAHTTTFENRHGQRLDIEIDECDALLYIMCDQPNEPQLTASATESRGGSARLSDERD